MQVILAPPICSIGEMKTMDSLITFLKGDELWMQSFDPQLKQNAEWCAQRSPRKKTAWPSQSSGSSSAKWTCAWQSHTNWYNGQWPILLCTPEGYVESSSSPQTTRTAWVWFHFLQDDATSHHHCDVQKPVPCCAWGILAHPPYSPALAPHDHWLFACVKEHLRGKLFELEDDVHTTVIASLHCLRKDEYKAATDHLPHIRGCW